MLLGFEERRRAPIVTASGRAPRQSVGSARAARGLRIVASIAIGAVFLLGSFLTAHVEAYGIEAWTAAVRGASSDPNAFPGPLQLMQGSHALALDASNNVYVTGTAFLGANPLLLTQGRLLTIKYDATGAVQWSAYADGDQPGNGAGSAVTSDGVGNVYVVGVGGYGDGDAPRQVGFLTLKYDSDGAQVWRVLGTDANNAYGDAVAVDASGNVLVAGRVFAPTANPNVSAVTYLTIKYDASGAEQWRAGVSNAVSSNQYSGVTALGVDGAGNVYLAAMMDSIGGSGYFVVSYDQGGNERWRATPKASTTSTDYVYGATVDANGNAYVTGTSFDGNTHRAFTIKYDTGGVEQWRALSPINDSSNGVAVDGSGNVYVAGGGQIPGGQYYVVVIKYGANGVQQWRTASLGTAGLFLNSYAVSVDGAGRVYSAGMIYNGNDFDFLTISYSSGGAEQWRKIASGAAAGDDFAYAMKADAAGNAYVAGSSKKGESYDWLVVKYSASGGEQWRANEGVAWTDAVIAAGNTWTGHQGMAADTQGNVYLAGYVEPVDFHDDIAFLTVKLDPNGTEIWRATPVPMNISRLPHALTVDTSGSVYVAGTTGDGDDRSFLTIKYSTSGQQAWQALSQNVAGASADDPNAIAVDASHNVYVTGTSLNTGSLDYFTVKYDAAGAEQWRRAVHDPLNGNYFADAVAADSAGNAYVTGFGSGPGGADCLTVAYDPAGNERWRATCSDQNIGSPDLRTLVLDNVGNVYVAGSGFGPGVYGFLTIKYSSSGAMLWRALGLRGDFRSSFGWNLAVDNAGNAYVLGSSGTGSNYDYLTIKYDSNGVEQWRAFIENAIDWYVGPNALAVDGGGNVYVTGAILDGERHRYITVKYDGAGNELWRTLSDDPVRDDEFTSSIALGPGNAVYVAGQSFGPTAPPYMVVRKLVEGVLPSETTIVSGTNPSVAGEPVLFTATVEGYLPKGTLSFNDAQSPIAGCAAITVVNGGGSCNALLGTAGTHLIAASYSGDGNNAPSVSPSLAQIALLPTTTNLGSSLNPAVFGQTVSLTATVSPTAATGTVAFWDGNATICPAVRLIRTRTAKSATCTTSALSLGPHMITAAYSGDAAYGHSSSAPLAQVITLPPPGVSLKSSQNPSAPGTSVTFTATVAGQTPTGTVTFKDGVNTMCSGVPLQGGGNSPSATCMSAPLSKGGHSITALYSGDAVNPSATSPVLTQTVKRRR